MRVQQALVTCSGSRQGLATPSHLSAVGVGRSVLSRAHLAGEVHRVRPGVYSAAPLPPWPTYVVTGTGAEPAYVQQVRAVLLSLGQSATASGVTAACLRGWGVLLEPQRVVDVSVPNGRSRVRLAGVRSMQRRHVARALWRPDPDLAPLWTTTPVQTVLDCCRTLPHLQAVVVVDSALRSGQVTLAQLALAARALRGRRAARRVVRALASADAAAGSVLESVLRVRLQEAGLGPFTTQVTLSDSTGRRIVRVDFCFVAARLVVEADGSRWHTDVPRDRQLDNRLAAAGWRVLRFTWAQVVHDGPSVVALVRAALLAGTQDVQTGPVGGALAA